MRLERCDRTKRWTCAALVVLAAALLPGCAPEEKIVNYKPFFTGLEGMKTQTPPVIEKQPGAPDATEVGEAESLVVENPDGSVTLISRTGAQLMYHIQKTLAEGDDKLFAEQVLCEQTRNEYKERGVDPREALKKLKPRQKDIGRLFARMPMAEHSPNCIVTNIERNMFRVKLNGQAAKDVGYYTGFDMVMEKGNWKLRWFLQ